MAEVKTFQGRRTTWFGVNCGYTVERYVGELTDEGVFMMVLPLDDRTTTAMVGEFISHGGLPRLVIRRMESVEQVGVVHDAFRSFVLGMQGIINEKPRDILDSLLEDDFECDRQTARNFTCLQIYGDDGTMICDLHGSQVSDDKIKQMVERWNARHQ